MPDRNIERLLRSTHVPVDVSDQRGLDIIVSGLRIHHCMPLFCDATIFSPIAARGHARGGTSNRGAAYLKPPPTAITTHTQK